MANIVLLIGRLTKDPDVRYTTQTQTAVATFTLAVNRPYSKEKEADFIRIIVYGKSAENCKSYLAKGRKAAVQGRIQTGSYKKDNGDTVYTTDVIAERVEFLDSRSESGNSSNSNSNSNVPDGFHAFDEEDETVPF